MKNSKLRRILLLLASLLLVAILSVGATMAYLTSSSEVTNTFTVGKVKIELDEAKVDEYGVADTTAARVTANEYKLIPGHNYVKDPTIHVDAESENCYLFVEIINDIAAIEASSSTIASQMAAYGWVNVTDNIYCKCDNSAPMYVAGGTDVKVFDSFTIRADVEDLSAYAGLTVKITAYAIQADGFEGKDAATIWAALNK